MYYCALSVLCCTPGFHCSTWCGFLDFCFLDFLSAVKSGAVLIMQQHVKYCLCWDSVQRTNKNSSLLHPQEDPFSHLTNFIRIPNFGVTDLKDYTETRFWFVVLYVAHNLILKLSCTYTQNIFELREQFEIGSNLRFSPALSFFLWISQTHQNFTESEWEKRLKF